MSSVRRVALWAFFLVSLLVTAAHALPLPEKLPPNVVVIIGDDMGWPDFGFLGNDRVQTPSGLEQKA